MITFRASLAKWPSANAKAIRSRETKVIFPLAPEWNLMTYRKIRGWGAKWRASVARSISNALHFMLMPSRLLAAECRNDGEEGYKKTLSPPLYDCSLG